MEIVLSLQHNYMTTSHPGIGILLGVASTEEILEHSEPEEVKGSRTSQQEK